MNILDIAIAKKLAGGGGGSGTDDYNDLSNLPKINGTTLSGNKSSSALGLQSEINSESKLASDLVDDTNQDNKFVTSTEKQTWNAKQNAIDADHKINADYVDDSTSTNKFVTASDKETWNAKQNAIDNSHKLSSDLVDDTNHTNKFVTSSEKQTWNAKQNAIDSDHKLSSSLVSFTTAEAAALASGIDSSKVGQISTNQTNILYALDKVGTNYVYDYEHGMATPTTMSGVTFTWLDNGKLSIQSNGTNTSDVYYNLEVDVGSRYVGKTMSFVGGVASKCAFYISNSSGAVAISTTSADVTIPSDAVNKIFIAVFANAGTLDIVVEPMIRDSNITSNTYSAPALPNYDLTRLESEDRAALAEEIDAGAKNKWDFANVQTDNWHATTSKTDTSFTITSTDTRAYFSMRQSLPAGHYVFSAKISNRSGPDYTGVVIRANGTSGTNLGPAINFSANGTISGEFTCTATTTVYFVCYASMDSFTSATTYTVSDIMVCTKAAFGVSKAFVPYRPNYDLVAQTVAHDVVFKKRSETITTANAWQVYSSLAVTLPVGKTIDITAAAEWSHNSPASEIAIIKGTTVTGTQIIATNAAPSGGQLSLCAHGMYYNNANTDATINVAVKYPSTENNQVSIAYRIF